MTGAGPRRTRQRMAVEALLAETDQFRTAQQIHTMLHAAGARVGLTTVYRTLSAMAQTQSVDVILDADGEARYRACSRGHHHHIVCRNCGYTVEITAEAVEAWAAEAAADHGFRDVSHMLEISGTCAQCAEAGA